MVFTNTPNSYTLNANKIYITKPKFLAIFIHSKNQRTKDKNNYDAMTTNFQSYYSQKCNFLLFHPYTVWFGFIRQIVRL